MGPGTGRPTGSTPLNGFTPPEFGPETEGRITSQHQTMDNHIHTNCTGVNLWGVSPKSGLPALGMARPARVRTTGPVNPPGNGPMGGSPGLVRNGLTPPSELAQRPTTEEELTAPPSRLVSNAFNNV